ncbi:hypothetical protein AX16_006522 [Volvariella volvacea WC 439]|nr:hypothetical protein AX16_006522 [Volvariella volvacea WC 439]
MVMTGPDNSSVSPVHRITIPNELYRQILQFLAGDLKTLCAVAQCSRLLQAEAEWRIYSNLKFEVDYFADRRRLFGMLLHVVDKVPHHAKLVHSWEMLFSEYGSTTITSALEAEYVVEALKTMDNLKVLKVLDEQGHLTLRPSDLLVDLQNSETKFQLEEFGWNTHIEDPESFFGFLRKQNKLRKLDVSWPAPGVRPYFSPRKVSSSRDYSPQPMQDIAIPPDVAKDITHLVGTYNTIRAFLPGRPVTDLTWFVGEPETAYAGVIPPDVLEGLKGVLHFRTTKKSGFWRSRDGNSIPAIKDLTRWLVNVETLRLSWIHVGDQMFTT